MNIFPLNLNMQIRDKVGMFLINNSLSKILFGNNRSIIFNRAVTRNIIEHYNGDEGHQTNGHTGNLGYGFIHYSLILNFKPKKVLCVGSRKGFIPAICALALQELGSGTLDFVDAGYDEDDPNHWSGIGWWKKIDPSIHFSFLDLSKIIKAHIMTNVEFARMNKHKYDYIYIDGDHSYEGVKKDYSLFWPKLNKGGLMVFHDVVVKKYNELTDFGVWKFWKKLKNKNKITLPNPYHSGLGILQK